MVIGSRTTAAGGAARSLRTADLLALGVSPEELRGPRWRSPFRGHHTPMVASPESPRQRILDVVELIPPGGAIAGWSAGFLLDATELDGRGRSGRETLDVVVMVPRGHHPSPRDGVRFLRSALAEDDVVEVDGVPVTGRVRTAFDLARGSTAEEGLVDTDILCRQLALEPASVLAYAEEHAGLRGAPVARMVLSMVDPRSRSSGESRLRYIWLVEAGLPRPECNPYIAAEDGQVVAMPDLLDVGSGLCGEYDGAKHRQLDGHTADNAREEQLEDMGLVLVRATSLDVGPFRARTVQRLRAGQRRAEGQVGQWGWRPSPWRAR